MTPEKTDLIEVRQQLNLYPETLLYLLLSPGNQVLISTPSWAPWPEVLDFTPWPRILCPPIYTCDLLFMTTEPTLDLRHLLMDICFNRPGVTRDVLQTPSSLINLVTDPLPPVPLRRRLAQTVKDIASSRQ